MYENSLNCDHSYKFQMRVSAACKILERLVTQILKDVMHKQVVRYEKYDKQCCTEVN